MVDYAAALTEGIDAAKQAELAAKEIDRVFAELSANVRDGSGGQVEIGRQQVEGPPPPFGSNPLAPVAEALRRAGGSYTAITARSPHLPEDPGKVLARWQPNPEGYPCRVSWAGQVRICEDREALEQCLLDLLRDPGVGRKIRALMEASPANPPE